MKSALNLQKITEHCAALRSSLPLAVKNARQYISAIKALNQLLDAGGADEKHPLALAVREVGEAIAAYEAKRHLARNLGASKLRAKGDGLFALRSRTAEGIERKRMKETRHG